MHGKAHRDKLTTSRHPQNRKYRRGRSHAQPQFTCTENFVMSGHVVFEMRERTRQTGPD